MHGRGPTSLPLRRCGRWGHRPGRMWRLCVNRAAMRARLGVAGCGQRRVIAAKSEPRAYRGNRQSPADTFDRESQARPPREPAHQSRTLLVDIDIFAWIRWESMVTGVRPTEYGRNRTPARDSARGGRVPRLNFTEPRKTVPKRGTKTEDLGTGGHKLERNAARYRCTGQSLPNRLDGSPPRKRHEGRCISDAGRRWPSQLVVTPVSSSGVGPRRLGR